MAAWHSVLANGSAVWDAHQSCVICVMGGPRQGRCLWYKGLPTHYPAACCCNMCRMLYGSQARFFDDEISPKRKHGPKGCVGMASAGPDLNASQVHPAMFRHSQDLA